MTSVLVALAVAALPLGARGEDKQASAPNGTAAQLRKERDEFVSGVQKDLAAARRKLDQLKGDAHHASSKAHSDMKDAVRSMERQERVVQAKLAHLKGEAADKWKSLEAGVLEELEKLKQALRRHESPT